MIKISLRCALALCMAEGCASAAEVTDFGVRTLHPRPDGARSDRSFSEPLMRSSVGGIGAAASLGARWGRVTSTLRTRAHNRAVGGVRRSFHLTGRAIDIARRRGIAHSEIAAAFRSAGFRLLESIDEGDHSHFAFDLTKSGEQYAAMTQQVDDQPSLASGKGARTLEHRIRRTSPVTQWRMVKASDATLR